MASRRIALAERPEYRAAMRARSSLNPVALRALAAVITISASMIATASQSMAAGSPPACQSMLSTVSSPAPDDGYGEFGPSYGAVLAMDSDIWAVGDSPNLAGLDVSYSLLGRWNGTSLPAGFPPSGCRLVLRLGAPAPDHAPPPRHRYRVAALVPLRIEGRTLVC